MHAPSETERALAYALAVQVAFGNGLRGLVAMEAMENPEVCGAVVQIDADGGIDVQILGRNGAPISGYSL